MARWRLRMRKDTGTVGWGDTGGTDIRSRPLVPSPSLVLVEAESGWVLRAS